VALVPECAGDEVADAGEDGGLASGAGFLDIFAEGDVT
jgi:hypothetical protein